MRAKELCGEEPAGQRGWLRLLELQCRQRLRACELDFLCLERRPGNGIAEQLEGERRIVGQHIGTNGKEVRARDGPEGTADAFNGGGYPIGGAAPRPPWGSRGGGGWAPVRRRGGRRVATGGHR